MAVERSLGTNFPTIGPGDSARMRWMELCPAMGSTMSTNTSTPIPPIQWVKERQNRMFWLRISTFATTEAPVVVKPETISKKQST